MLNFAICDDNINFLDKFSKILENIFMKYNYDAQIGLKTSNPDELLDYVDENKTNVLILDINLKSNKSGLEIASEVREKDKNIYFIFTTAHLEYAMMAYKFKTFDYLAKPITSDKFEETIVRLFDDVNGTPKRYLKIDNKKTIIDENEVLYIKRDGMKLVFHTKNRDYETYSSFNKIQSSLPDNFVRSHKSFIVNVNNIENLNCVDNTIFFDSNSICDIGPKFKKELIEEVKNRGNFK
ncbi:MAG: response regulator transcription factor [Clostridia bacterium]|jgi:two-component system response regulator AgrA|nr:response regulator transcription factor [Clostridia bacterium]